jgi:hypothetical protein
MKFKAFVRVIGTNLHIRLGRSEAKFNGSIVKTLTLGRDVDNEVSVGVTKDDTPVFVRIMDAVAIDGRMMAIRDKVLRGDGLSGADVNAISQAATDQMRLVYDAYRAKIRKMVSRHADRRVGDAYDQEAKAHFDALVDRYALGLQRNGSVELHQAMGVE